MGSTLSHLVVRLIQKLLQTNSILTPFQGILQPLKPLKKKIENQTGLSVLQATIDGIAKHGNVEGMLH